MKGIDTNSIKAMMAKNDKPNDHAPSVDVVRRQRASVRGDKMKLHDGSEHVFQTEIIAPEEIESRTFVFHGNERDQDLLSPESTQYLRDEINIAGGQVFPAYGRILDDGRIEVACGSTRRFVCKLDNWPYKIKYAKGLTDEQMERLSDLENKYKDTSPYEKGLRYIKIMEDNGLERICHLEKHLLALFDEKRTSKPPSQKSLSRFIKTGRIPKSIVSLFKEPNDISASSGEKIYNFLEQRVIPENKMQARYDYIRQERLTDPDEIVKIICGKAPNQSSEKRQIGKFKISGRKIDCSTLTDEEFSKLENVLKEFN